MGDKGGKKGKAKSQKQATQKHDQKIQNMKAKQPKNVEKK
jgi:hypothetical protein